MTVDEEPLRGTDEGPPRTWKGVVGTDCRPLEGAGGCLCHDREWTTCWRGHSHRATDEPRPLQPWGTGGPNSCLGEETLRTEFQALSSPERLISSSETLVLGLGLGAKGAC